MSVPCYNCPNRSRGCHSACEPYAKYRKAMQRISTARQDEYIAYVAVTVLRTKRARA